MDIPPIVAPAGAQPVWRGAFDNLDDSEAGLREILEASFERVELETIGWPPSSRQRSHAEA